MDNTGTSTPESLEELAAGLRAQLGQGPIFQILNTRLIIQHGVNLRDLTTAQKHDARLLSRVQEALTRMGITGYGGRP